MSNIDPNDAVKFILKTCPKFAKAKADRIYLEEYRKVLKSKLFNSSTEKTIADRENAAYAHPDYLVNLDGLREAIEIEETIKWQLIAAQARVDIWRSQEASNRFTDRNAQ